MSFNDKITFFYTIEEGIWNNKVDANKYLATLSILFVAVLGGLAGGGSALEGLFNWDTDPSLLATIASCIFIWGANVAESIIVSSTPLVALLRSLLLLVVMAASFVAGYVLAVVVIIIVCIVLMLLLFTGALKGALSGGGRGSSSSSTNSDDDKEVLDFGMGNRETGTSSWDKNTFYSDSGKVYDRQDDGSWLER